jgi:NAD(P)-dependent dehydrogenase (short-subunit alcohol dehydrogenase family)
MTVGDGPVPARSAGFPAAPLRPAGVARPLRRAGRRRPVRLAGARVLVTGPARGIGAETARLLAGRGARLALIGLEPDRLAALAGDLGPGHLWSEADVTDQASLAAAVHRATDALGGLDVVVANAGIASYGTVRQIDPEAFRRTIDVNLTGVFRTAHATLPHLEASAGHLLVVASLASFTPVAGMAAYCAGKAGVEAFTSALRQEVAHLGVSVGSAHPSWIDTDLVREAERDLPSFRAMRRRLPWPANRTTSVPACAQALVDGIERRSRRVFVPRGVAVVSACRSFMSGPVAEAVGARGARRLVPQLEAEVAALRRPFPRHAAGVQSPLSQSRPGL